MEGSDGALRQLRPPPLARNTRLPRLYPFPRGCFTLSHRNVTHRCRGTSTVVRHDPKFRCQDDLQKILDPTMISLYLARMEYLFDIRQWFGFNSDGGREYGRKEGYVRRRDVVLGQMGLVACHWLRPTYEQISVNAFCWPDLATRVALLRDDSRPKNEERRPWNWMSFEWPSLNLENLFLGWDPRITLPSISNRVNQGGRKRRGKVVEFNCVFDDRGISTFGYRQSRDYRVGYRYSLFQYFFQRERRQSRWMKLKGAVWNNGSLVGVDGRTIFRDRIRYWIFFPPPSSSGNGIGNCLYRQATRSRHNLLGDNVKASLT